MCDLLAPELKADLPLVQAALFGCATPLIRNMATVGGGMAVVHLPSDLALAVLASGAEVEVMKGAGAAGGGAAGVGVAGARVVEGMARVPAKDLLAQGWLKGPDLVCRINVPKARPGDGTSYKKFGRSAIDIALVSAAVRMAGSADGRVSELCVVVGQTNSLPAVLADLEREAIGQRITKSLIEQLARSARASVKPRKDFRASAEYRQHLVEVMVARALAEAAANAGWRLDD
jgi:CO/xanthine dehydrogenase FAD-binding subunit